jgi:hypothetical protein
MKMLTYYRSTRAFQDRIFQCDDKLNQNKFKTGLESLFEFLIHLLLYLKCPTWKKSSTELLKQCQDVNNVSSNGEDCDVDCYGLFKDLHVFAAVIQLNISNIKGIFQFIIRENLGGVYPSI